MYYAIECLVTIASGDKLYVTDADPKVTATIKQDGKFRGDQLWQALYNPNNGGVCPRNKDSSNLLAVPRGNSNALLVANTIENQNKLTDPSAVLNIIDSEVQGYKIVRGLQDQDNNLNLAGDGGYRDGGIIKFWGWERKNNSNYKWKFIAVEL